MTKQSLTVGSATYQLMKQDIIFGVLAPGAKLKLATLKMRYGASLSTLRETLTRLTSEGFVKAETQRGFFVAPVSEEDLTEITRLRILLECHALEESIKHGDAEWEGQLVAAHHKLALTEKRMLVGDDSIMKTWKQYDWEFHLALIQACNSVNLLELHATLYDKYLRYQILVLTHRGEDAAMEHQTMFEAALERDSAKARQWLERHITNGLAHTLTRMNSETWNHPL